MKLNTKIEEYLDLSEKIEDIKIEQEKFIMERCKQLKLDILELHGEYITYTDTSGLSFVNNEYPKSYGKVMCVFFHEDNKEFLLRLRVVTTDKKEVLYNIHEVGLKEEYKILEGF